MAVENWDRYGTLVEKVAEDRDFWSDKASVDEVRAALPEHDHELLDELIAEVDASGPDVLLRKLRNAFTAVPAVAFPAYQAWEGYFLREDEQDGWVAAPARDADEWQPVGQEAVAARYFSQDMTKFYDETFGWVSV